MSELSSLPALPSWRVLLGIIAGFFALTFLIYGWSLKDEFVRWDDGMLVYENPAIREISPASIAHIFTSYDPELYIPLTFFTYQIDYQLSGQNAFLYHLDNLVLHTLNALLVGCLLYLLSKRPWVGLLCGLLFAVHPLHTEAVEWVSARKDVLSTFFFLLSLIGYLYWRGRGGAKTYWLSVAAFALGLMAKVMVITLPVILLLLDWHEGRKWDWRMLKEKTPYIAVAVAFGIIGLFGKRGVIQSSSTIAKILMAGKSAVFYLQQIVWPLHFSLLYPYTKAIVITSPDFYIPVIVLLVIAALAVYSLTYTRDIFFALAFYFITVAPTFLNFAKGGDLDIYFASDRYAYVPSIGIFFLLGVVLWHLVEWKKTMNALMAWVSAAVALLLVAGLSAKAYAQSLVWKNTETLFENVLTLYPESSYVAHNNLGNVYRLKGEYDKAIVEYQKSIAIRAHPKTISNLGAMYRKLGRIDDALAEYRQALSIDPNSKEAHFGLGIVYAQEKQWSDAVAEYQKALLIDPQYVDAYTNLGSALMEEGNTADAIVAYRKALAIDSYFTDAQYNLAVALTKDNQPAEAISHYERVVAVAPSFTPARINLGVLYFHEGRAQDARRQFEAILVYDPENAAAQSALAQLGNKAQ